jgi:hypothetical protein
VRIGSQLRKGLSRARRGWREVRKNSNDYAI